MCLRQKSIFGSTSTIPSTPQGRPSWRRRQDAAESCPSADRFQRSMPLDECRRSRIESKTSSSAKGLDETALWGYLRPSVQSAFVIGVAPFDIFFLNDIFGSAERLGIVLCRLGARGYGLKGFGSAERQRIVLDWRSYLAAVWQIHKAR